MNKTLSCIAAVLLGSSCFAATNDATSTGLQTIYIDGNKIELPANSANQWLQIKQRSDGKNTWVMVKGKDLDTGKIFEKTYTFPANQAGNSATMITQFNAEQSNDNNVSSSVVATALQQQQEEWQQMFRQQQAEMAAQMAMLNQQMHQMQQQVNYDMSHQNYDVVAYNNDWQNSPPVMEQKKRPWWKVLLRELSE